MSVKRESTVLLFYSANHCPTSTFSSGTTQAFFLGNLNKRAKVIILQIKGLANQVSKSQQQKSTYSCKKISASQKIQIWRLLTNFPALCIWQVTRKLCEEELLKVKGVISFTFVMNKSRCVVRCKLELSPEALCDAINKTKVLSAQQVVKNEHGEEVQLASTFIDGKNKAWPWPTKPKSDQHTSLQWVYRRSISVGSH